MPARSLLLCVLFALLPSFASAQAWTFTRTGLPGPLAILDLAYGNGRFVATTGHTLIWSPDGLAWHPVPGVSNLGSKLLFISGSFYALGSTEIWQSADGQTWTRTTIPGPATAQAFGASDGRGLLTTSGTGNDALSFSPDMRTFRRAAPLPGIGTPGTFVQISGIAHGAGRYFVSYLVVPLPPADAGSIPGNSGGYLVSTTDGTTWTHVAAGMTTGYRMAGTADRFLVFLDNNRSLFTTDGTRFVTYPLPFSLSFGDNLVSAGGRFLMSRSLVSSLDGLTWAPLASAVMPPGADLRGFAYGRGKYISAGFTASSTPPADLLVWLAAPAPPVFATQPAPLTLVAGNSTTLSATLENPDTLTTFQWYRNGVALPGATLPTLTLAAVTAAHSGDYTLEARNALGRSRSVPASVTIVPPAEGGRLVNLSILSSLAAPDDTFTVGFVIGGSSGHKPLLVRAAGPSLSAFAVTDPNPDPRLELFTGSQRIAGNDNWNGSSDLAQVAAQVGAFAYTAIDSKDAALFAGALAPGNHTVKLSSATGANGTILAEVYDATPPPLITASTPRLANVSVLKPLAANTTLSAGFVIGGRTRLTVLVRAIGPSLASFGIDAPLANPRLTLRQPGIDAPLAENDDWATPSDATSRLSAAFAAVGAFSLPADSRDAVLLLTLAPGNYVAEAQAAPNTSGTVLIEIYEVP